MSQQLLRSLVWRLTSCRIESCSECSQSAQVKPGDSVVRHSDPVAPLQFIHDRSSEGLVCERVRSRAARIVAHTAIRTSADPGLLRLFGLRVRLFHSRWCEAPLILRLLPNLGILDFFGASR